MQGFRFTRVTFGLASLSVVLLTSNCSPRRGIETPQNKIDTSSIEQVGFPSLGEPEKVAGGISRYKVSFQPESKSRNVWIYLPENQVSSKIPVILIAAAGSRLIDGASLDSESLAEHMPYANAGFAVIAYDIDGNPKNDSDDATLEAVASFVDSNAGLKNQKLALDFAIEKVKAIDPNRIFIAGHSSAGTHALFAAAKEPRIKGVIAYAPATDPEEFLGKNLDIYDEHVPGLKKLIIESSPLRNVDKLRVPVFLFHSVDDSTVNISMSEEFIDALSKHNRTITFVRAKKGGHYSAMIEEGIPKALEWLKTVDR